MAINVDDVATDEDLATEVGGASILRNLLPDEWLGKATSARQQALDDVVRSLKRRTPPILEEDLRDVTELREAVVLGALERLFRMAMHQESDAFGVNRRIYDQRFRTEVSALSPTLVDGARSPSAAITINRR